MHEVNMKAKKLVENALIAAVYTAAALLLAPISYGVLQFRVSEALTLLPFMRKDTVWGVTVGCLLANLLNPLGVNPLDVIFGTLATLIAALLTARCKNVFAAAVPPVAVNAVVIGAVLAYSMAPDAFLSSAVLFGAQVGLGQLVACFGLGIPLVCLLKKLGILKA